MSSQNLDCNGWGNTQVTKFKEDAADKFSVNTTSVVIESTSCGSVVVTARLDFPSEADAEVAETSLLTNNGQVTFFSFSTTGVVASRVRVRQTESIYEPDDGLVSQEWQIWLLIFGGIIVILVVGCLIVGYRRKHEVHNAPTQPASGEAIAREQRQNRPKQAWQQGQQGQQVNMTRP